MGNSSVTSDYSLASMRAKLKEKGVFYTPKELAELMKKELMLVLDSKPTTLYDPTCGRGNLLSVWDDDIKKIGFDIDNEAINDANANISNFSGGYKDTACESAGFKVDAIVANPPFSVSYDRDKALSDMPAHIKECYESTKAIPPKSKADWVFILHILEALSDNGAAAVLSFPGILYRGNSEGKVRRWVAEQGYINKIISIPPKTFEDTSVATVLLILTKKKNDSITFVNTEDDVQQTVQLSEILKDEDVNLSVNRFAFKEEVKPQVDPCKLHEEILYNSHKSMLDAVKWCRGLTMCEEDLDIHFYSLKAYLNLIGDMSKELSRLLDDVHELVQREQD